MVQHYCKLRFVYVRFFIFFPPLYFYCMFLPKFLLFLFSNLHEKNSMQYLNSLETCFASEFCILFVYYWVPYLRQINMASNNWDFICFIVKTSVLLFNFFFFSSRSCGHFLEKKFNVCGKSFFLTLFRIVVRKQGKWIICVYIVHIHTLQGLKLSAALKLTDALSRSLGVNTNASI